MMGMTLDQFRATLGDTLPPNVTPLLRAMWHDAKGNWDGAHGIAQDLDDADAAWVHAYLHRKEGDAANAAYWYRRANRPVATDALDVEWVRIVGSLLEEHSTVE
jgi:hypothetical protein